MTSRSFIIGLGRAGRFAVISVCASLAISQVAFAHGSRTVSGVVETPTGDVVAGVRVVLSARSEVSTVTTAADGTFSSSMPMGAVTIEVVGDEVSLNKRTIGPDETSTGLRIRVTYLVPPVQESVTIVDTTLDPGIDRRNERVYRDTLFSRDDQLFHTLDAGINAGQHEGGGKSLEIRRYGFNLDHGGVGGGLKVLVDNFQQNQGTQGHGQGYLGQLKSLSPELVADVDILNGPFSAQYGDFSGLGVVHIRQREALPDLLTLRVSGGTFDTFRTFLAVSPRLGKAKAFLAYEGTRTDGPFLNPLDYERDNVSGNLTMPIGEDQALSFRFNYGRNNFTSSGQIPLDEVAANRLDRFGFVDPTNGGEVDTGLLSVAYRREFASGTVLKADGFVGRSLFDLYSNFTFFLNDEVNGDGIQQHDSRLQEGANLQLVVPFEIFGSKALLTTGGNFHDNQINVGLFNARGRDPYGVVTKAHAHVTNGAGYVQQALNLLDGHLHVEGGLRLDVFRFAVDDRVDPSASGVESASRIQPKASVAWTPTHRAPMTLYLNYGRGISSQDARGVVRDPSGPKIATTDFYQAGQSTSFSRFSLTTTVFLIDRSNEQVYIPDDASIEFAGPSRSYGWEAKFSTRLSRHLTANGGITKVTNAFYRATSPIVYVDSAPHTVANAALTLSDWRGFSGSLRYRHIGNYRLDGQDANIRAAGLDVVDLSLTKRLARFLDLNVAVDNATNKRYFETQNYFESRLRPGDPIVSRIHGTPGYPFTITVGLSFRLFATN